MEIRSTTDQDLEVFVDTILAAFGRFREAPAEGPGNLWSAYEMDRNLLAVTDEGRSSAPPGRTPSSSPCPVRSSPRPPG